MGKEVVVSGWEWGWFKVGKLSADTPCVTLNFSIHPHNWPNENTQQIIFPSWHSDMSRRFSEAKQAFFFTLCPLLPPALVMSCSVYQLLVLFPSSRHCCHSCSYCIVPKGTLKGRAVGETHKELQSLTSRAWSCGIDVVNQPDSLFRRQKTAGTFHRVYLAIMFLNWQESCPTNSSSAKR